MFRSSWRAANSGFLNSNNKVVTKIKIKHERNKDKAWETRKWNWFSSLSLVFLHAVSAPLANFECIVKCQFMLSSSFLITNHVCYCLSYNIKWLITSWHVVTLCEPVLNYANDSHSQCYSYSYSYFVFITVKNINLGAKVENQVSKPTYTDTPSRLVKLGISIKVQRYRRCKGQDCKTGSTKSYKHKLLSNICWNSATSFIMMKMMIHPAFIHTGIGRV